MIVQASAPSRISIMGGGTDLFNYSSEFGGLVISMAINLRTHISFYREMDSIGHPGIKVPHNADPELYYSILNSMNMGGMHKSSGESTYDGVIGAGLGSSASFCVALIAAIKKSRGEEINRSEIAELAFLAEHKIGKVGGKQDQYAAAHGGTNLILFTKKGKVEIFPYERNVIDNLLSYMVLYYTGGTRESSDMQQILQNLTIGQIHYLNKIKEHAYLANKYLLQGNIQAVGELLHYSWAEKKKLNKHISNVKINDIYDQGLKAGAIGGKLCGAGGCGYMVFMVDPVKREKFIDSMLKKNLEPIDFSCSYDGIDVRYL